jgi:truncated hemoglobin YjbI
MNSIINLTPQQLRRAADVQERIASLQKQLQQILGSPSTDQSGVPAKKHRRRMSAAARGKIAAAQRARWAKQLGKKATKAVTKPRRKMSVAARKRMAQAAKERWAKAKAAGRRTL